MIKLFFHFILFIVFFNVTPPYWLDNEIKHEIAYVGGQMNLEDWTMNPAKYIVWIELTEKQKEEIKGISYEEWLDLLLDGHTDYGTNLLLYSIFEKDAIALTRFTMEEWQLIFKEDDYPYWRDFLVGNHTRIEGIIDEK